MNPESFLWSYYYYTDCNEAVVIKILFICYIISCVGKIITYRKYLHQKIMRQEEWVGQYENKWAIIQDFNQSR